MPAALQALAEDATALVRKWAADKPGWSITSLFITASNFADAPTGASNITRFLKGSSSSSSSSSS